MVHAWNLTCEYKDCDPAEPCCPFLYRVIVINHQCHPCRILSNTDLPAVVYRNRNNAVPLPLDGPLLLFALHSGE